MPIHLGRAARRWSRRFAHSFPRISGPSLIAADFGVIEVGSSDGASVDHVRDDQVDYQTVMDNLLTVVTNGELMTERPEVVLSQSVRDRASRSRTGVVGPDGFAGKPSHPR